MLGFAGEEVKDVEELEKKLEVCRRVFKSAAVSLQNLKYSNPAYSIVEYSGRFGEEPKGTCI